MRGRRINKVREPCVRGFLRRETFCRLKHTNRLSLRFEFSTECKRVSRFVLFFFYISAFDLFNLDLKIVNFKAKPVDFKETRRGK